MRALVAYASMLMVAPVASAEWVRPPDPAEVRPIDVDKDFNERCSSGRCPETPAPDPVAPKAQAPFASFDDSIFGPYTVNVTPWLRVERPGLGGHRTFRVERLIGTDWAQVPNAHDAASLLGGQRAIIDRAPGFAIIDQQGNERAHLPCATWISPDQRRIYCLTAPAATHQRPEQRILTVQTWSDEADLLEQHTAYVPPADRPGFARFGEIKMIGVLSSGEAAIQEVCEPRPVDASKPRLGRLFALRGHKLVLIASGLDMSPVDELWRVRLPEGLTLPYFGQNPPWPEQVSK